MLKYIPSSCISGLFASIFLSHISQVRDFLYIYLVLSQGLARFQIQYDE